MVSDWLQKAMLSCLTTQCPLCKLPLGENHAYGVCNACQSWYQEIPRCLCCGLPTLVKVEQCGHCLSHPPLWNRLYCVGDYNFPLSHSIHQLKYQSQFWQARPLALRLAERIENPAPLITCVPLHWKRLLRRGFNQSDQLAKNLATTLDVNYRADLFSRTIATPTQRNLSRSQRQGNLSGAFRLNQIPDADHIAIVDDVVTTGSTVRHLCHLLLEVGVKRIDIYCICRTPEPKDRH